MLPTSGPISIRDVATELKLTPTTLLSLDDVRVRKLANKLTGSIGMGDLYGKSNGMQVNMLHGANAAKYLVSNPDAISNACFSKGFYFTTDDDSEITFSDLAKDYYNAIQPNESPITTFGEEGAILRQRYDASDIGYPLTVNTTYHYDLVKYPLEYYQYPENSVKNKKATAYTYYPTGTLIEFNTSWYMLVIDNLSKANSNVTTKEAVGPGTFNIARIKEDAAKVTDKLNVGAIIVYFSAVLKEPYPPYGVTIERTKIKSASTGLQATEGLFVMDDAITALFKARKA